MWTPGTTELILILVLVLIFFGAGKLPEIGKALGKGIRSFKDGTSGDKEPPAPDDSEEPDKPETKE